MKTLFFEVILRANRVRNSVGCITLVLGSYAVTASASSEDPSQNTTLEILIDDTSPDSCHMKWVKYWDCVFFENEVCEEPECDEGTPEDQARAMIEAYMGMYENSSP